MPAAVAVPAAISAGSSIFSGILGSRAANKAAQIQQQEALRQAQGYRDVLSQYNPQIGTTAEGAATGVLGAAGAGAEGVLGAAGTGAERVLGAAATGAAGMRADTLQANEMLQPYIGMGAQGAESLREFMAPGGAGTQTFTADMMEQYDPGYKFRLDMAQQAAEKSAAARGGVMGGGFAKALAAHQQGLASEEYGAAAERFRRQQDDRYKRLFGVSELGARSAGEAGQNLIGAGKYGGDIGLLGSKYASDYGMRGAEFAGDIGMRGQEYAGKARMGAADLMAQNAMQTQRSIADMMTGGAQAQAAGTMGSANAWSGMLGGLSNVASQVGQYYQDKDLMESMKNPAIGSNPYTTNMNPALPYSAARPPLYAPNYEEIESAYRRRPISVWDTGGGEDDDHSTASSSGSRLGLLHPLGAANSLAEGEPDGPWAVVVAARNDRGVTVWH